MIGDRDECEECVADALLRAWAAKDLVDLVLWGETNPVTGIDGAISSLKNARRMFVGAGFRAES